MQQDQDFFVLGIAHTCNNRTKPAFCQPLNCACLRMTSLFKNKKHCYMTFTVNVLLTCILTILWCQARLWLELFASTVGRFLSWVSYLPSYIFLRRHCCFTARKLYTCLGKFLVIRFSFTFCSSLCFWSSMYRFIPPLIEYHRIQM